MSAAPAFVVTTEKNGKSQSHVWRANAPLGLGHPYRFVLENTATGVRIRTLHRPGETIHAQAAQVIPHTKIQSANGGSLTLDDCQISLKPLRALDPAFSVAPTFEKSSTLTLFMLRGNTIVSTLPLLEAGDQISIPAFDLKRTGDGISVTPKADGLVWAGKSKPESLAKGKAFSVPNADVIQGEIRLPAELLRWRISALVAPTLPVRKAGSPSIESHDFDSFKKALQGALGVISLILLVGIFWPQSKAPETELMPAQIAKIVMKRAKKTEAQPSSGAPVAAAQAPKAVQQTKVVQAFRTAALQNAVSGLLKGGMTKLLAQSDLAAGLSGTRELAGKRSNKLGATTGDLGTADPSVKVASLGGTGAPGSVGYAQGEKAGVAGQGGKFVSTDIAGATVEEGLTRDEVGAVIHKHMSEIRYCYESSLLRMPSVEGKLLVGFTIGANGMVKANEIKSSTLPDPRLDDCVIRRLVTWKFPLPKGGIDVAVSYPFIFKSLGR